MNDGRHAIEAPVLGFVITSPTQVLRDPPGDDSVKKLACVMMVLFGILAFVAACVGAVLYAFVIREVVGWSSNGKNG